MEEQVLFAENTARSENREIDTGGWKVYYYLQKMNC